MNSKLNVRDISPMLQMLRNFLLGRTHTRNNRFEDQVSTRSPDPPNLPEGPCHGIADNYYYARDARREMTPPTIVVSEQQKIGPGSAVAAAKHCTPGAIHHWD